MRDLSMNSQMQALGAVVARAPAATPSPCKRREEDQQKILDAMRQFTAYTWATLLVASRLPEKRFLSAMRTLTRRGHIHKTPEGPGFLYSLPC